MKDVPALAPAMDNTDNIAAATGEINSAIPTEDVIYASSSSEDVDLEKQRHSATSSDDVIHDHVDIQYAEQQFADLKRRYSNLTRVTSATSHRRPETADGEKRGGSTEEKIETEDVFDLEDILRDRHRREVEHDIKPKHLGMYFNSWFNSLIY